MLTLETASTHDRDSAFASALQQSYLRSQALLFHLFHYRLILNSNSVHPCTMLTMLPSTADISAPVSLPDAAALPVQPSPTIRPMQPSSVIRPKMPRLRTLKTFNIPQAQVDEVLLSASSLLPTPTSEILGGHPLRVLIAPSGFKESLGPEQVRGFGALTVRQTLIRHFTF